LIHLPATLVAVAVLAVGCGGSDDKPTLGDAAVNPGTVNPAVTGCDPEVDRFPYHVAYAKNRGDLALYSNPGDPAPYDTMANPRMTDSDPPLEMPLAFLIKEEPKENDCEWINVWLPIRPNGSTAWVRRDDVDVEGHVYRMEVHLADFTLKAWEGDKLMLDAQIGTALENTPTPGGLYYTTELLHTGEPDSVYGPYAFGLSGFSEVLTSFNGGQGQLGIHGTNQPEKIPGQVSAGCIRLKNEDLQVLVDGFDTTIGIPVQVYA
jgi:hypothetical protein